MILLGETSRFPTSVKDILEEYVCLAYGVKNETNVDKAPYHLFTNRSRFPEPHKLPPTRDALNQHLNKVNYQTREWKSTLTSQQHYVESTQHGWICMNDESLEKHCTNKRPAPDSILESASCNCKRSKGNTGIWKCKILNICCTDFVDV